MNNKCIHRVHSQWKRRTHGLEVPMNVTFVLIVATMPDPNSPCSRLGVGWEVIWGSLKEITPMLSTENKWDLSTVLFTL